MDWTLVLDLHCSNSIQIYMLRFGTNKHHNKNLLPK
nr:MAG TPA: hypothetical protein [Caudoviricetes sp.]